MTDARTERAREAAIEFVRKEPNSLPWVSQQNRLIEALTAFAADEVALALEEAIAACENEMKAFGSEEHATGQPISSISERFACKECIKAIRALKEGKAS